MFDEKEIAYLQEMKERITRSMAVLIESDVTPKFNLLADGIKDIQEKLVPPNGGGYCKAEKGELNTRYSRTVPMFGIVIFYPAGQPIRNRSGAEKCRMHGVPCFAAFHLPRVCSIPLGWSEQRERNPKRRT